MHHGLGPLNDAAKVQGSIHIDTAPSEPMNLRRLLRGSIRLVLPLNWPQLPDLSRGSTHSLTALS
jgi:hypothetical protein